MNNIKDDLLEAIETSKILGLDETDLSIARDYLENNELELCLDTLTTQLYEYDIKITKIFYELIDKIAKRIKLGEEKYIFMKQLIIKNNL